jgi:hypothetical protein
MVERRVGAVSGRNGRCNSGAAGGKVGAHNNGRGRDGGRTMTGTMGVTTRTGSITLGSSVRGPGLQVPPHRP